MKEFFKKNKVNILIMLIYSIFSFIIVLFHESWRDEAQAWLIARDLDFFGIIQQMKYEGHFLIWYIILIPFAKLGLPYEIIKIVSWLIVNISVWLILKKAPFKIYVKILIIFSLPLIYLYPAIARCYCLIPLAIVLIAICYKDRKTKPIQYILSIILLANTHVIMLGLVGMLLLTFYIEQIKNRKKNSLQENRKIIISFFIASILLFISILPILQSLSTNAEVNNNDYSITINHIIGIITKPIYIIENIFRIYNFFFIIVILFLFFICAIYELREYTKNFIILFISIFYQILIYEYIYFASEQRACSIILMILLFVWIQKVEEKNKNISVKGAILSKIMIILLIFNCIFGVKFVLEEIKYPYSSSKQIAEFINTNLSKESKIISRNMPFAESVIPYLKEFKIWHPRKRRLFYLCNVG